MTLPTSSERTSLAQTVRFSEFAWKTLPPELFMQEGKLRISPDIEGKNYFEARLDKRGVRVQAKGYIGVIPVNDRLTLDIRPRVPVGNVARLLSLSGEATAVVANTIRDYATAGEWLPSLAVVYAASLREHIETIVARGLHKEYRRVEEATEMPRGRINIGTTLQRLSSRNISHKAVITRYERTIDNPSNRCLLYGAWRLSLYLRGYRSLPQSEFRRASRDLNLCHQYLQGVTIDWTERFLQDGYVEGRQAFPTFRNYYRPALDLALAIIGRKAVLLDRSGSALQLPSLLISMSDVFEGYLRELLIQRSRRDRWPIEVVDGNLRPPTGGAGKLFHSGADVNATPDVVLRDTRGKHPLLVEVKYKPAEGLPDRSALNQAISYGAAYDASHLVIAQPRRAGSMIGSRLRQVGVVGELTVHQYIFDLAAQDLGQEEDSWIESIRRLASSVTAGQFGTQNGQSVNTPV